MGQVNQPSNLLDQIADIRRQLSELRGMVGLASATITTGGLKLLSGAFLSMVNSSGVQVLYIGPDGNGYQGIQLRRRTGSLVMTVQRDATSGDDFWAMWDKTGHIVVSDDIQAGFGLARPYLDIPMYPGHTSAWQSTTSGSPDTLWYYDAELQHPKIDYMIGISDTGAGGTVRLLVDGTPVATQSYTAGSPTVMLGRVAHGVATAQAHSLTIDAQRTSGAGALFVVPYHIRGTQS